ncbi:MULTISPECIES: DUF47 domain-containing protein [Rummeliibacillus]|uniref:DUF47 domain-containing protein n=1 Tax=Rummeliibacillus TaxID=648802 RepID=UPI0011B55588|nr:MULTISPECIES: DUF47 family protein [Rummeliibacillus]MBO2537050.1 DUF47 family protein [Rummeliibacillus suwonensis]
MKENNFFDKIFPKKYNFYSLLLAQSKTNYEVIHTLDKWIKDRDESGANELFIKKKEADKIRLQLEHDLIEAFVTPFDRQDLYSISVEMNKISDCSISIFKTIKSLNIEADSTIIGMSSLLSQGAIELNEAILILEKNPAESQSRIEEIRIAQKSMEDIYISGLSELFINKDSITILKYREVYNVLKEAAILLGDTVDIYHRICVRVI